MAKPVPRPFEITSGQCRAARGLLGLTQEGLAELAGISPGALINFESGETRPQAATMAKLVAALTGAGISFLDTPGGVGVEPPTKNS